MFRRFGTPVHAEFITYTACERCGRKAPVSPIKTEKGLQNLCPECAKTCQTDSVVTVKRR